MNEINVTFDDEDEDSHSVYKILKCIKRELGKDFSRYIEEYIHDTKNLKTCPECNKEYCPQCKYGHTLFQKETKNTLNITWNMCEFCIAKKCYACKKILCTAPAIYTHDKNFIRVKRLKVRTYAPRKCDYAIRNYRDSIAKSFYKWEHGKLTFCKNYVCKKCGHCGKCDKNTRIYSPKLN